MPSKRKTVNKMQKDGVNFFSLPAVLANKHLIKVSSNEEGNILVVIINLLTSQSIIKYFSTEIEANVFISKLVDA